MRNLKKFLALVMAMVMAFSLMLSASAANTAKDFDDADQITEAFVEATDVLTGMKVFQGDEGGFRPADTITRAEVAALIYRLATGDVDDNRAGAYANYGNFADVAESDWFAGYVGYCANAGYIKGHGGYFNPYDSVTGYEALAMILRAIGYDKNGEFTGSTWETNVSALATQLGILTNIKTTHYGNTLYLASRRDVVAELLFQADAKVNMVNYTPAFGYQPYGDQDGVTGSAKNPTLGQKIFGLALSEKGVLLGNQQTGETGSVMGYASDSGEFNAARVTRHVDGSPINSTDWPTGVSYTAYTWKGPYNVATAGTIAAPTDTDDDQTFDHATDTAANAVLGTNEEFELETGIDLIGHNLKLWYDDGSGVVSNNKKHVYAYFDKATHTDVVTVVPGTTAQTNATAVNTTSDQYANGGRNLFDLIEGAGFKAPGVTTTAVFNNSFGRFGSDFSANGAVGNGVAVAATNTDAIASPVRMYKLISNSSNKQLDAVIALNIESSQITESNNVNRVPTLGIPVMDNGTVSVGTVTASTTDKRQLETMFITTNTGGGLASGGVGASDTDSSVAKKTTADLNVKDVNGVLTGVIAQDALVGNSTKALGDYEFGIHITGTTPRTVSSAEATAINNETANQLETAYFLLNKVTAPVEGTVVAYNVNKGTVTLDNGTVLERSKYYHTVTGWSDKQAKDKPAPNTAIPQGWIQGATNWEEGYANVGYKFYLDHEGKYLGAERSYGASFLYGTYQDYSQKTSTSAFNYFLTGVTLDGEIKTVQLKKYWKPQGAGVADYGAATATTLTDITGTTDLGVPFRDTFGQTTGVVNGIGTGVYRGFAITGDTADAIANDPNKNRNEYLNNMNRLGIHNGAYQGDAAGTAEDAFDADIQITGTDVTLGAKQTTGTSNKYFTEATKFILVSGYGTDSVKAEVYNGISELKGSSSQVVLNMDGVVGTNVEIAHILDGNNGTTAAEVNEMTYYTESPYTYAQSGATAMKIDTIILPKAAVSWSGGSGLYYVGDPNYTSINSWGTDAWKYNLYQDGELEQVWLTNDPNNTTAAQATTKLTNDVFLNLKDTGKTANDGEKIYTAGIYNPNGSWEAGVYFDNTTAVDNAAASDTPVYNGTTHRPNLGYMAGVTYSAVTRDAQTATFGGANGVVGTGNDDILERVAEAKVVNLNAQENCIKTPASGYIWPGITDLQTLNQAGSIDPVTGRALKVSAVVDPSNPLVVTCIYVCYDQN